MEKTNCSMQNIFDWCLRNNMGIEFQPLPGGDAVMVIFSKHVLGKRYRWSKVVSSVLLKQLVERPSFFWSRVVLEAQRQLSEKEIAQRIDILAKGDSDNAIQKERE